MAKKTLDITFTFRLSKQQWSKLRKAAKKQKTSMATLLREYVESLTK